MAETTAISTIIVAFNSVNLNITESICNQIWGSITVTLAFCAFICVDIVTTAVATIKKTGSVIVFVVTISITMPLGIGTAWNEELTIFWQVLIFWLGSHSTASFIGFIYLFKVSQNFQRTSFKPFLWTDMISFLNSFVKFRNSCIKESYSAFILWKNVKILTFRILVLHQYQKPQKNAFFMYNSRIQWPKYTVM